MLARATAYLNPTPVPARKWERTLLLRDAVRIGRMAYFSPSKVQELYDDELHDKRNADAASYELMARVQAPPVFCNSPIGDSQGYVIRYAAEDDLDDPADPPQDYIVLACRGTSSLEDALCDANLRLTPLKEFPDAMVHAGFLQQFRALEPLFEKELDKVDDKLQDPQYRVLVVGHSLGKLHVSCGKVTGMSIVLCICAPLQVCHPGIAAVFILVIDHRL